MSKVTPLSGTEKLELANKVLDFLRQEIPNESYISEVLILAYHAETSTHELRCLVSSIS